MKVVNPDVLYNKGTAAFHEKKYDKALKLLKESNKIHRTKEALLNIGAAYKMQGDLEKALKYFTEALREEGEYPLALNNIGLIYHMKNQEEKAMEYFNRALEIDPKYADAGWNRALSVLKEACSGEFTKFPDGWTNYEWRFLKSGPVKLSLTEKPRWRAEEGHVLIMSEQGVGDMIMFSRYLPFMKNDFTVQCIKELEPFFQTYKTTQVSNIPHDYHVPMCSLPNYFGFIPGGTYFHYNGDLDPQLAGGTGVVWKGNPEHGNDKNRSTFEANFSFLKEFGDVYSLQYGTKSKHFKNLDIKDWNDTIKYIASLDRVVTIDSSVAHVAGALGKPVYILLPGIDTDFRWGLYGNKSIWYDSATLIRNMNFGELKNVLSKS